MEYTENELWLAIRQERAQLMTELKTATRRIREIEKRLEQLDKAEDILEGGL